MFLHITSLALIDAINPCTIAVQAMLLSAILLTKGRRDALIAGILFSLTIYSMYLLYGLGIINLVYILGLKSVLQAVLKLLLGVMFIVEISAYFRYRPGFISMEMPLSLRPIAKKCIYSVNSTLMAVPVAALCSVLLLPCSSGPYLAALMLISNLPGIQKVLYMLYYCLVFILPMLLITFGVYFGMSPEGVMQWRNRHVRELHLLSGLLLLLVLLLL